jgi:nucleoside-diphosphate-sugar epimerase
MRILLAGTDGFIGGALRRHLVTAGHEVHGTTFYRAAEPGETRVDLRRDDDLDALPEGPYDAAINATGIVDQNAPRRLIDTVNATGTGRLLDWAARHDCAHFVQLSSVSVAGPRTLGQQRTEASTGRYRGPFSFPYARSKARAEELIERGPLPYTILRLPAVIGVNDSYFSRAVVPRLHHGTIFTCGGANPLVTLLYVENLGPIISVLLDHGPLGQPFNCGCHDIGWETIVGEYADSMGIEYEPRRASRLSILTHLADKRYLLVATFSAYGSHFPNAALGAALDLPPPLPWQRGVRQAVASFAGYDAC